MNHLESYLNTLNIHYTSLRATVEKTSLSVFKLISNNFDYKSHITGLLLGNVQSGKTGQLFGVVSKLADEGFEIFILLTSDNVYLQKQTTERTQQSLTSFNVYGELDDLPFFTNKVSKPIIIVLKKNTRVLRRWRNLISSSGYCSGRPIVIIDDEADSASLNTLVNKNQVSAINNHLANIKELSTSSLLLQVTATPQAILLQSNISGWKPKFIYYFPPGNGYIGGDFVYAQPKPYCIEFTNEDELDSIKLQDTFIPDGLKTALISYLIVCAHFRLQEKYTCNFLVHPSVRIADHSIFSRALGEHLNLLLLSISDPNETQIKEELKIEWLKLQSTKPDIENFEDLYDCLLSIIENEEVAIFVLNSTSDIEINFKTGYNIIVGGNSLGRGVTFPHLQTVYYCRKSKTPQADTFWQHSRVFGYDRERELLRVYIPPSLYNLFSELNISNKLLINQIANFELENIQLIYPIGIRPTRKNVLDNRSLNLIVGGVNFFASHPKQDNETEIDILVSEFDDKLKFHITSADLLTELLVHVGDEYKEDWDNEKYINIVKTLSTKRPTTKYALIIRRDRNIGKGTGTLLSPTDRKIGDSLTDYVTLTLYKTSGTKDKGWNGKPFYIPNIKLPNGLCIYDTIEIV